MQKVVTINLNGRAYQLDENGYDALRAYLDRADAQLKDNPDRAEIIADLEQAIADKCRRYFTATKTVVDAGEIATVLEEMGPVVESEPAVTDAEPQATGGDTATAAQATTGTTTDSTAAGGAKAGGASSGAPEGDRAKDTGAPTPKRLYRVNEGAIFGGVCNGLAAYFNIDVTVIRVIFVVFTIVESKLFHVSGLAPAVYLALMFFLPSASTSEERAAASGAPFNAREVVEQAKKNYATYRGTTLKGSWKAEKHEWRRLRREARRRRRMERWGLGSTPAPADAPYVDYGTRVRAGVLLPILMLVRFALFWVLMFSVISVLTSGSIRGWRVPGDVPVWLVVLGLFALVQLSVVAAAPRPPRVLSHARRPVDGPLGRAGGRPDDGCLLDRHRLARLQLRAAGARGHAGAAAHAQRSVGQADAYVVIVRTLFEKLVAKRVSGLDAGPFTTPPVELNCEPWHGH